MAEANGLNGHANGHIHTPTNNTEVASMQARYSPEAWQQFLDVAHNALMVRRDFMKSLTDPRRDLEDSCGYPRLTEDVSVDLYKQLYDRDAIAARVVEVLPMESWQVHPTVYETEDPEDVTAFEEAWDGLGNNLGSGGNTWFQMEEGSILWDYLRRADILSGIGKFGVIFLGIDDGKNPQDPADGVSIIDRQVEPITKRVDIKDDQGKVVGNRLIKVGARVTNTYGDHNPFAYDSPMTETEEASLRNLKGLTAEETLAINQWKKDRELYVKNVKEYARNQQKLAQTRNTPPPWQKGQKDESKQSQTVEPTKPFTSSSPQREQSARGEKPDPQQTPPNGGANQPGLPPRQFDQSKGAPPNGKPSPNGKANPQQATDTGGAEQVTGTDQQYLSGLGMPAPGAIAGGAGALSGTDQQYYGVQFGPSESPDSEPAQQPHKLLFVRCFDESLLQVVRYEWNINNPRFGMPVMYRITLNDPREMHSGVGLPMATIFVHWSRLIHVTDLGYSAGSSEIFSKPRMQQVLNNVLGIRKLSCGSPEMYWRGAFPGLALSTHPQLGGDVEVNRNEIRDSMENYFNDLQRYLLLTGMSANTLSPTVVDPTGHIDVQIQLICIKLACPKRVFMGSERGELASSQDDSQWNDVKRARQNFYITPRMIVPFVDRCIQLGLLPAPESYSIKWPDLESLSDKDKAAIALQQMQMLQTFVSGNVATVLPTENLYTDFLGKDQDEMQEIMQALQDQQDQMAQQQQSAMADGSQFGAPPQSPEDQQALEDMGNEFGGTPPDQQEGGEGDQSGGVGPDGNPLPPGAPQPGQPPVEEGTSDEEASQPDTGEDAPPPDEEGVASEEGNKPQPPIPPKKKPNPAFPPIKNRRERSVQESDKETLATLNSFLSESIDDIENRFCSTGRGGGVDPSCGKEEGNVQSDAPRGSTKYENKTFKGTGTQDDPIRTEGDIIAAAKLLGDGKHVRLKDEKELGQLFARMEVVSKQALAEGKKPPHFDMCKAGVGAEGFCEENIGTPRSEMPQMRGFPVPGTLAATKTPNKAGKVDLSAEFIDHLKEQGVKVHQDEIRASQLKASQSEIVGARVNELVQKAEAGEDLRKRPIFVTKDDYVLDGHHHWAALVALGAKRDKDYKVPVHVLDMDIKSAIKVANDFAKKSGIAPKSGTTKPTGNISYEESDEDFERRMIRGILRNAFCATGVGGGVDATCSPSHGESLLESLKTSGGFTYQPVDDTTPKSGYAVAAFPGAEKILDLDTITPSDIFDYLTTHASKFDDPRVHVGGWTDKGKVYLDLSMVVKSKDEAISLGVKHNQLAVFDLGKMETVTVPSQRTKEATHNVEETHSWNEPTQGLFTRVSNASRLEYVPQADWEGTDSERDGGLEDEDEGYQVNAYCPTGEGGGVDDSCPPYESEGGKSEGERDFMPAGYQSPKGAPPNEKLPDETRPKVDVDQANAIENYTRYDNRSLNRALYQDKPIPTDVLETHHNLQAAFAQAKVFDKPVEVYRGVQCKKENLDRMVEAAKKSLESGQAFSIKGYQSTTTNPKATFSGNVQMKINAVHGIDARPFSNSPHEDELLLNKESSFTVKSMKVVDGTLHLELDQQPPKVHSKDREYIQKYKETAKAEIADRQKAPSERKSGGFFKRLFGKKTMNSNPEGHNQYTNQHSYERDMLGHSTPEERLTKWDGFGSIHGQQLRAYQDSTSKKAHTYLAPAEIKELQDKGFLTTHKKPKITEAGHEELRKSKDAEHDDIQREVDKVEKNHHKS